VFLIFGKTLLAVKTLVFGTSLPLALTVVARATAFEKAHLSYSHAL